MFAALTSIATVTAFIAPYRRELPERCAAFRRGLHGARYTPVALAAGLAGLLIAYSLAEIAPILKWGWLGHNILVPAPGGASDSTSIITAGPALQAIVYGTLFASLVAVFLIVNYDEETWGRESWWHVGGWAIVHVVMGIPVFAVIPIFCTGIVFKRVHDSVGFEAAFAAHVATNTCYAALLTVILFVLA